MGDGAHVAIHLKTPTRAHSVTLFRERAAGNVTFQKQAKQNAICATTV